MYNLNSMFTKFYEEWVRLPEDEIKSLRSKKTLNIDRLKEGLKEYNEEHKTDYKLVETIEQGSVAMRTVTQHDQKEYDIDIAIVFDANGIPEGTKKVKSIVEDALQRKCAQFKASPEAKTNAVTIEYASGYHIDFAIYRRTPNLLGNGYKYEHCGSEWRERDPRALTNWFTTQNQNSNGNVRKIVRMLKMFCKSNSGWLMPGGLIQSILVAEQIKNYDRLDETFYETIKAIKNRLDTNKEIYNPTLFMQSVLYRQKDHQKVKNLCTRLGNALDKLAVLFDGNCTEEKATDAWKKFFNHDFWGSGIEKAAFRYNALEVKNPVLLNISIDVLINKKVKVPFEEFNGKIPKNSSIIFKANPRVKYERIEWIVHNYGDEAGEDIYHKRTGKFTTETTSYRGTHTMTCKLFEGNRVIAQEVIPIRVR